MCSSEVLDLQAVLCWCNPRDLWVFWNKNGQKKESVYLCAWSGYYWGCDAPISCSNIELQDHFMHHVLTLGRDKDSLTLCFSNQCPSFSSKRILFFHSSSVFHLFWPVYLLAVRSAGMDAFDHGDAWTLLGLELLGHTALQKDHQCREKTLVITNFQQLNLL